jgi:hypothetical protein
MSPEFYFKELGARTIEAALYLGELSLLLALVSMTYFI